MDLICAFHLFFVFSLSDISQWLVVIIYSEIFIVISNEVNTCILHKSAKSVQFTNFLYVVRYNTFLDILLFLTVMPHECHDVSSPQQINRFLNSLFRLTTKKSPKLHITVSLFKELSMTYHPLWDGKQEWAMMISQCTRHAALYQSDPWVWHKPYSLCSLSSWNLLARCQSGQW